MLMRKPLVLTLLAFVAFAAPAYADPPPPSRHTVLRVDGDDVWVDLGENDGVGAGSELVLYDVVIATHPVTGKKVRDTFEVGRLTVVVAGKKLAMAHPADAKAKKRVDPGDEVTLASAAVAAHDPWDDTTVPAAPAEDAPVAAGKNAPPAASAPEDAAAAASRRRAEAQALVDEEAAVRDAWNRSLGKPAPERVEIWKAVLVTWPKGRFAAAIRAEMASLSAQADAEQRLADARAVAAEEKESGGWPLGLSEEDIVVAGPLAYTPPRRVYQGEAFEVALLEIEPGSVKQAWVHVRPTGAPTYRRIAMTIEPGGALRARVPGDDVRPPGMQYFVEVLDDGADEPENVVGSPDKPAVVDVDASAEEPPRQLTKRSRVTLLVDYVDFDGRLGKGHDQYVQFEADFMYRFLGPVYAMRLGFASMAGEGGPKDAIAAGACDTGDMANDPCRRVAFTYSYVELEFKLSDLVAVMVRPMAGGGFATSAKDPAFDDFRSSVGLRGRVRIGHEQETNLALGVASASSFGTVFEAAFTWDVVPCFPIVLSTQVTDQPVADDFGVRLIADVGYRGLSWVYPSLRLAYQARNIDLSGVSAGFAVNFDW